MGQQEARVQAWAGAVGTACGLRMCSEAKWVGPAWGPAGRVLGGPHVLPEPVGGWSRLPEGGRREHALPGACALPPPLNFADGKVEAWGGSAGAWEPGRHGGGLAPPRPSRPGCRSASVGCAPWTDGAWSPPPSLSKCGCSSRCWLQTQSSFDTRCSVVTGTLEIHRGV